MSKKVIISILVIIALGIGAKLVFFPCVSSCELSKNTEAKTKAVLDHHLEAFGGYNIDEIMKDYTEDSVVIVGKSKIEGLDAIRGLFVNLTQNVLPKGSQFKLGDVQVVRNIAYITWNAASKTHIFPIGTDTFLIKKGKIKTQTIALQQIPRK